MFRFLFSTTGSGQDRAWRSCILPLDHS